MASYTTNYGLHQWEATDNFLRTDFNADFQKIDTAIRAAVTLAEGRGSIVTGRYVGNGETSQTVTLGFRPKALLVVEATGIMSYQYVRYGGLVLEDADVTNNWGTGVGEPVLTLTATGFRAHYDNSKDICTNYPNYCFHYVAFR